MFNGMDIHSVFGEFCFFFYFQSEPCAFSANKCHNKIRTPLPFPFHGWMNSSSIALQKALAS